ncbi:RHS repeat-associated core domain-containing protein [Yeguia hominis]|uniref:RHS repeat-associated core domain-containing protein n=1 Tax=Yeguia hominis TaxID=2763662 RepID=A0A926D907_9FIRM|nr:RHS repeat-associated core domain-containing protein [Yeguia hominis]MBC8533587.1 RHS repeat-associated core domain-containing protein [Yeguia hominis]
MRVGNLTYTYDNLGNIKTVKEGTELKESYTYDSLNQLTRHDSVTQNKTIVYTYDAGGNILNRKEYAYTTDADLSAATPTSTVVYTYGDSTWKDKLTAYDGQSIAYDAIGNPITYRGWSNTWQGRQLASTSQGGMTLSFKYNVDGIRTQKTVNGTATNYFLNGNKILAQKTGSTVTWFYYDQEGTRVAMEHGGKLYYYLYNLQGDVIALCDASSKQIVAKYSYDAWGKLLTKENLGTGTIADVNPFRYRGYYYDSETGMYYLNSRYYDPEVGRFPNIDAVIAQDSVSTGNNLFAYCRNNPIIYADHMGYYVCSNCGKYTPPSNRHSCTVHPPEEIQLTESEKLKIAAYREHKKKGTTNPANQKKHEEGETRRKRDQRGEKGDARRKPNPNKRKPNLLAPEQPEYEYQNDIGNDVLNGVIVVGGTIAIVCLFIDDGTGVGILDDAAIPPLLAAVLEALQGM